MISIQFSLLLSEAYLEEEMICFWVWKKVREKFQKYWKSQGISWEEKSGNPD